MAPENFVAAVLAFLDQFIERGAAPDAWSVRHRLLTDSALREKLEAQLPGGDLTDGEAYVAMHAFLESEWKHQGARDMVSDRAVNLHWLVVMSEWRRTDREFDRSVDLGFQRLLKAGGPWRGLPDERRLPGRALTADADERDHVVLLRLPCRSSL